MIRPVMVLMAAAALFAAGCGGDVNSAPTHERNARGYSTAGTQLTPKEYGIKLRAIVASDFKAALDKLNKADENNPDPGTEAAELFRKAADNMAALNVPTAMQSGSKAFVTAVYDFADQIDKLVKATKDKDANAAKEVQAAMVDIKRRIDDAKSQLLSATAASG